MTVSTSTTGFRRSDNACALVGCDSRTISAPFAQASRLRQASPSLLAAIRWCTQRPAHSRWFRHAFGCLMRKQSWIGGILTRTFSNLVSGRHRTPVSMLSRRAKPTLHVIVVRGMPQRPITGRAVGSPAPPVPDSPPPTAPLGTTGSVRMVQVAFGGHGRQRIPAGSAGKIATLVVVLVPAAGAGGDVGQ